MFVPPSCPNPACVQHRDPDESFYRRHGSYHPICRNRPVPRFVCKSCGRGFSRQTFRHDYCDNRPDLNAAVFRWISSGMGLRQCARHLRISPRCLELKFRKIAAHLARVNLEVEAQLSSAPTLMLDEMETFEQNRRTRPLTLPVLIERESMYILDARCAPIRPSGSMPPRRLEAIRRDEKLHGPRPDLGQRCLREVMDSAARVIPTDAKVRLICDQKSSYPGIARSCLAPRHVVVEQHSSKRVRNERNPLFRINLSAAMLRDLLGRLRRRTWLASKKACFLDAALHYFRAWRNLVRPRFNGEKETPAQHLGFVSRRLRVEELLAWRLDIPEPIRRF